MTWRTQQDGPGTPFFNNTFGRRIAANGGPIGADFFISAAAFESSIAYNTIDDEFLFTARNFFGGGPAGIYGQRLSGSGVRAGESFTIATAGAPAPAGQVAWDSNGDRYLATWRDQEQRNLQGQLLSASGGFIGGPIVISSTLPSGGRAASVAFDPGNNRYLVVVLQGSEIVGQFVANSGQLLGTNFVIATGLTSPTTVPHVAHGSIDNAFLVIWGEGSDIVGRLLSDDGGLIGNAPVIAKGTAAEAPALAYNTRTGEFLAVWSDIRNVQQGEQDIFAQLISITDCSVREVSIDIKPGSFPNSINPRSRGVIPGAILTTDSFDATTVDPLTVKFGPNGATESHSKGHIEDVDGDGDDDLVLHFSTEATGIQCGQTSASLIGKTFDGQEIEGSDSIVTVGCK